MRYYPAAIAISLLAAVTASVGQGATHSPDPRAAVLVSEGRSQLSSGNLEGATDAFEAALVVDPAYTEVFVELADVARQQDLQGKAIRYYREALKRDPDNFAAISGEGTALIEKGAIDQAKMNLSKLETMCGEGCDETQVLAAAISRGPSPKVMTAEAAPPVAAVTQN